ncbi:hypothetical protein [Actinoplanes sp. DH11]|uniref:hypothetical protein n=1 Tax=Actinoplanes sp. DH11 TaxID=2857011 RepID=UPI001E548AD8|nr:hypothetical protein [Actinoplanes sp. DH11]
MRPQGWHYAETPTSGRFVNPDRPQMGRPILRHEQATQPFLDVDSENDLRAHSHTGWQMRTPYGINPVPDTITHAEWVNADDDLIRT